MQVRVEGLLAVPIHHSPHHQDMCEWAQQRQPHQQYGVQWDPEQSDSSKGRHR